MPRTSLTTHFGGRTRENLRLRYGDSLEDVLAWQRGEPVRVIA